VITYISDQCRVHPENLYVILTPTTSITGCTQISGRVVETGIHKLERLGFDPKAIMSASGHAAIAPVHPKLPEAMGRTNDAILYTGVVYCNVSFDNDKELSRLIRKAPSSASKSCGKPFLKIFEEANQDFYQIDSDLFAPAVMVINNLKTGGIFRGGKIDCEIFK
ncbi:MAG: methenyltetrahydromethanopterin cyclohydrolase, partial [Desulfobacterales bacterium]|nr:methenyltetrahydromethanopterin cyclohydrolase [Desulfobacterales bacterium]